MDFSKKLEFLFYSLILLAFCKNFFNNAQNLAKFESCSKYMENHTYYNSTKSFQNLKRPGCYWRLYAYVESQCWFNIQKEEKKYPNLEKKCNYDSLLSYDSSHIYVNHCGNFSHLYHTKFYGNSGKNFFILTFYNPYHTPNTINSNYSFEDYDYESDEKKDKGQGHGVMLNYKMNKGNPYLDHTCEFEKLHFCVENLNCENGECHCLDSSEGLTKPKFGEWRKSADYGDNCDKNSDCNVYLGHSCLKDTKKCECNLQNSKKIDAKSIYREEILGIKKDFHRERQERYDEFVAVRRKLFNLSKIVPDPAPNFKICGGLFGKECIHDLCYYPNTTICENNICVCEKGYKNFNSEHYCLGLRGSSCQKDKDCIENLVCHSTFKKCDCPYPIEQSFDETSNKCMSKLNQKCTNNDDCLTNSICKHNICQCENGYGELDKKGICYPGEGQNCSKEENCLHESLECKSDEGICGCKEDNYYYENLYGKCLGMVGTLCESNSDCGLNMICKNNTECNCAENLEMSQDKKTCVAIAKSKTNYIFIISVSFGIFILIVSLYFGFKFLKRRNIILVPKSRNSRDYPSHLLEDSNY